MSAIELQAEVAIEFGNLDRVVEELIALRRDVGECEPTLRELVAGGAFLIQFYNGIENLLKRISKHQGVPLPEGRDWHVELFRRFCSPSSHGLPVLFDEELRQELRRFRGFRHIARTSYGTDLEWSQIMVGIDRIEYTYAQLRYSVHRFLNTLI